jgi:ring-1,2-phenylacetyl-CoA epoxidase subunit PaaC
MNLNQEQIDALKELLYKMADDQLILGHRNSEWTGLGPVLEEDIAFSSMAQDKIGQAYQLYSLLSELGESDPDTVAFTRNANQFHCSDLVTYPIGEYDFSLVRHFYFDNAELLRFEALATSSFEPLAMLARKYKGEIKYHVMHADVWLRQLAQGNVESKERMQNAINETFNLALGIFEKGNFEKVLIENDFFVGEESIQEKWYNTISEKIVAAGLKVPVLVTKNAIYGGRNGKHSQYLQPMLDEMTEVYSIDPSAEW